jgi:hypothetical protein
MLERGLSFAEQKLSLFLEKLSASLKELSAWAGWPRKAALDNSLGTEAQALTKAFIQQRSRADVGAVSPGAGTRALRPVAAERPRHAKAETTTHFSITIRSNGQEHTYDTTSGISDELASKLMDELGLPPEEFQTLVRLRQHRLQEAAVTPYLKTSSLTRCPICGNESTMAGSCPKCGSGRAVKATSR